MTEIDQFIQDMADSVAGIKATDRQKEVFKASLRYAIHYAKAKAEMRATLHPLQHQGGK